MLSHSNGSFLHAWMLKEYPEMISRSCFIDPVVFCIYEGDACYNFIHRPCCTGMELLMRYFIAMELGIANQVQRNFDWPSNSLSCDEIRNAKDSSETRYLFGGMDIIVCAESTKAYLTFHGVDAGLDFNPDGVHGQVLWDCRVQIKIIQWLKLEA